MSGGADPGDVVLLGTGPLGGMPVEGCRCRACGALTSLRQVRRPARAIVGHLELDCSPGARHVGNLLWAPRAGLLDPHDVDRLAGARLRLAVLGPHPTGPVTDVAWSLARLRAADALAQDADVVLVGLTHDHPAVDRLPLLLRAWNVRTVADRDVLRAPSPRTGRTPTGHATPHGVRTLVLGGASSGKSSLAEGLLAAEPDVTYIATGPRADAGDAEWSARVRAHRDRRPAWWRTLETADAAAAIAGTPEPALLDAVGTWLAGVLDGAGAWEDTRGWREAVDEQIAALVAAWRDRRATLVAVAEEVGSGVIPPTPAGRLFRAELGKLNQLLAAESERVLLVVAGRAVELSADHAADSVSGGVPAGPRQATASEAAG